MTIRKNLRAKNGHRVVTIVAEDDEAIVVRDHVEMQPEKLEVRTMVRDQRRTPDPEGAAADR